MAKQKSLRSDLLDLLSRHGKVTDNVPSQSGNGIKTIGLYLIEHVKTGKFFVGISKNLYTHTVSHKSLLNKNKHYNKHFQKEYNKDCKLLNHFLEMDLDAAYALKQTILDMFFCKDLLFNSSDQSGVGRKAKKISINGKVFNSIHEAHLELNIPASTIGTNLANNRKKDWFYIQ